jgi:hypothetical protein
MRLVMHKLNLLFKSEMRMKIRIRLGLISSSTFMM